VSEIDTCFESSTSSIDLEYLEEQIYLRIHLISALKDIKKFRSINMELEEENRTLNEELMNLQMCWDGVPWVCFVVKNPSFDVNFGKTM